MKKLRILKGILIRTRASKILIGYLVFVLASALIITLCEPDIRTYRDALWYCYTVVSTAGFGDIVVTTAIGKMVSVILTIYSVLVVAIVTGVVVSYYNQIIQIQQKETLVSFIDKLEKLPELSKDELLQISKKASLFPREKDEKS